MKRKIMKVINKIGQNQILFFLLLLLASLNRNGFAVYGTLWRDYSNSGKCNIDSLSVIDPMKLLFSQIGHCFGAEVYFSIYTIFVFLILKLIHFEANLHGELLFKKMLSVLALLPGVTIVLGRYGTLDLLMISFSILAAITISNKRQATYFLLMALSHTEASLIISIALFLTLILKKQMRYYSSFISTLGILYLFLPSLILFLISLQMSNARVTSSDDLLLISISQALSSGYWLVFSWFGGLIFLVFRVFSCMSRQVLAIYGIPLLILGSFSLLTADGTRVATMTLTFYLTKLIVCHLEYNYKVNHLLLFGFLTPGLYISNFNVFLPFRQILHLMGVDVEIVQVNL
jgi:hypothetical protein